MIKNSRHTGMTVLGLVNQKKSGRLALRIVSGSY